MSIEHGAPTPPPQGFGWQPAPPSPVKQNNVLAAAVGAATVLAAAALVVGIIALVRPAPSVPPQSAPTPELATPKPQFSPEEVSAAKDHLCRTFDISVRGQQGQGGLRGEGNLNVPVTLRSVNSALAVQVALVPAVPADVAKAARSYAAATLDATTAAMGNPPASEVNRLTDIRNDALQDLFGVCGLPR